MERLQALCVQKWWCDDVDGMSPPSNVACNEQIVQTLKGGEIESVSLLGWCSRADSGESRARDLLGRSSESNGTVNNQTTFDLGRTIDILVVT
jgi:hypothetical protein